jgi:excisionase family DNA binding protein
MSQSEYLSTIEASVELGIGRATCFRWIKEGKIPAEKLGRNYRIPREAFERVKASLVHIEDSPPADLLQLITDWERWLVNGVRLLSPRTAAGYKYYFRVYLKRIGGAKTLQEIVNSEPLSQVLDAIPIASYSNRYNLFNAVNSFGKFLVGKKLLPRDVLDDLKGFRPKRYFPARKTVLQTEEIDRFLNATWTSNGNTKYEKRLSYAIIRCFLLTGLRNQELCDLTLVDVHLKRRQIFVRLGKGSKTRYLGINLELARVLEEYLKIRPYTLSSAFFIREQGKKLNLCLVSRRINRLELASGLDITPHRLRRTWVTQAALKGRPIALIAKAAGYLQISTTQGYLMLTERQVINDMQNW